MEGRIVSLLFFPSAGLFLFLMWIKKDPSSDSSNIIFCTFSELSVLCKWKLGRFVSCGVFFCLKKQLFVDGWKWPLLSRGLFPILSPDSEHINSSLEVVILTQGYQHSPSPQESTLCSQLISGPSSGRATAWCKGASRLLWPGPWSSIARLSR